MKTFFFLSVMCIFCGAAFGQTGVHASTLTMSGSTQQATQVSMAPQHDLREASTVTSAHGERPLWEVMPETQPVPLGDVARQIRKEHETAKKAVIVWKN